MNFHTPHPVKIGKKMIPEVIFSEDAFRDILLETQERIPTETGGVMLGYIEKDSWIILEVIDPGPNSYFSQTLFEYDYEYQEHLANKIARRYNSLELLGLWHRHPSDFNDFSHTDFETFQKFTFKEKRAILSGLVNLVPKFQFTLYFVDRNISYYYEVEYCIKPIEFLEKKFPVCKKKIEDIKTQFISPNRPQVKASNEEQPILVNNNIINNKSSNLNKVVSFISRLPNDFKKKFLTYEKTKISIEEQKIKTWVYELFDENDSSSEPKNYEETLVEFDKLLASNPKNTEIWFKKSLIFNKIGNYEYSIKCLDKIIELNPKNSIAWYLKGELFSLIGQELAAINCYNKSYELNPDNIQIWMNKAVSYEKIKKYSNALDCYDKLLAINPKYLDALIHKGLIFQEIGQYENAIYYLTEALNLDPSNVDLWNLKGSIYSLMNKNYEAINCYNESLKINPDDVDVLKCKSWIFHELGMRQEENVCNEIIESKVKRRNK